MLDQVLDVFEIKPDYEKCYLNRGNSKFKLGDYNGAIEDCNIAIEINPENKTGYLIRENARKA